MGWTLLKDRDSVHYQERDDPDAFVPPAPRIRTARARYHFRLRKSITFKTSAKNPRNALRIQNISKRTIGITIVPEYLPFW